MAVMARLRAACFNVEMLEVIGMYIDLEMLPDGTLSDLYLVFVMFNARRIATVACHNRRCSHEIEDLPRRSIIFIKGVPCCSFNTVQHTTSHVIRFAPPAQCLSQAAYTDTYFVATAAE